MPHSAREQVMQCFQPRLACLGGYAKTLLLTSGRKVFEDPIGQEIAVLLEDIAIRCPAKMGTRWTGSEFQKPSVYKEPKPITGNDAERQWHDLDDI